MNILGIAKFLQKRPKDRSILLARSVFGILLIAILFYNFFLQENPNSIQDSTFGINLSENAKLVFKYIITAFGAFPLFMGITNLCITRKKYVRIIQILFGVFLFYFSFLIVPGKDLDIETLLSFVAFLPIFAGITGKCITQKCLKYGEKIKKIRV